MIWEILIAVCLLIGIIVSVVKSIRNHKRCLSPFGYASLIALGIFFFATMVSLTAVNVSSISLLTPVDSQVLEEIDGYYVIEDSEISVTYRTGYNIKTTQLYFIVDIGTTELTEPTVYKCKYKNSLWIMSDLLSIMRDYDVIVVPNESIKRYEAPIPEWL